MQANVRHSALDCQHDNTLRATLSCYESGFSDARQIDPAGVADLRSSNRFTICSCPMTTIELDPISNPIFLFPKQSESDDTVTVVVEGLLHIADAAVKPESLSAQWTIELERDDVVHPIDVLRPSEIRAEGQHGNDSIYRITLIFLLPQTWAPTSSSPFETISHHVTASLGQTGSDDYCTHQIPIQVISMHDPPGQLRRVTAQNRLGMSRAGSIEINIHSDNVSLPRCFH